MCLLDIFGQVIQGGCLIFVVYLRFVVVAVVLPPAATSEDRKHVYDTHTQRCRRRRRWRQLRQICPGIRREC